MKNAVTVRKNKHFVLDQTKLKKAQRALGAKTETETIERALTLVLSVAETERRAWAATEKLIRGHMPIVDVFGRAADWS
jgi:hypothetical protein